MSARVTRVSSLLKICEEIYGERISTVRRQAVHHDLPRAHQPFASYLHVRTLLY